MRKLARAAIAFSAAVFAANYILSPEYIFALASVLLFLGIMLCLLRAKGLRPIAVILIFVALGLFCFRIHYQNTYLTAKEYAGERHKISAEVLDYPQEYKDYLRLEVRITSGYLPNFKSLLYDNEKALLDVKPGDSISFYGRINTADTIYGEKYSNYHSNGFYFKLTPLGRIKIERSGFDIFMLPKYVSNFLSSRIGEIFNDDVSVFMRSLMLGDKADFYEDESLYVDMSRAGLMHIVAVSGMHISFLVSLLHFILGEGRRSAVICLMLVWFFALVTGAGPSVLRASFMYTTMLMAPVLRRENDTITSMSAILALILYINPYAATSVSLQLSFAAMAGIMLFTGRIYSTVSEKLGTFGEHELVRYVLVSASSSLSVMVFTVPLTALHFGTVPILSPITNLMSLWAVSYCFCGGWISCVLSYIPLLGDLSVWACSALARYIMLCAEIISSIPIAVLYIETRGAWLWVCLSYVLFTIFALLRCGAFVSVIVPAIMSIVFLAALFLINDRYYENRESADVLDVGQGQCICVFTDEATVVIDCGNISTIDDAGMIAGSHIYSRGRNKIDVLILSHLHADHADGVVTLMEMLHTDTIILPADCDDGDGLYDEIVMCARKNGTELIEIHKDKKLEYGDLKFLLSKNAEGYDENERGLITWLNHDDYDLLIMADATARMEKYYADTNDLSAVDGIVVSHHGSRYSSTDRLLSEIGGDTAVISVGNNNYGHPEEETLEALEYYGYNIYRTDEYGNIELLIGK